jgi:ribonuclease Z
MTCFRRPGIFLVALALIMVTAGAAAEPAIRVRLLGTGGPELTPHRLGAATLVEAKGQLLLFDAGRGVMQRLYESRVQIPEVTRVFFTHLHSDHIDGLPNLWMTSWFLLGRSTPMEFRGPEGTKKTIEGMTAFFSHDMVNRVHGPDTARGLETVVHEFTGDGAVYERDGVVVTAFAVDHKDGNPAFGFRIDCGGRSVVLSGDCTYSPNLVAHAKGADVIVHNVFAVSAPVMAGDPVKKIVAAKLASPEQAARVFLETRPRLAVFSHIIRVDLVDQDVVHRVRAAGYSGELVMGLDRMVIEVGEKVSVIPPPSLEDLGDVAKRGDH